MNRKGAGFDAYFLHMDRFRSASPDTTRTAPAGLESFSPLDGTNVSRGGGPPADHFPILVRVPSADFRDFGLEPEDFRETARIGAVVSGSASRGGIEHLST